MYATILHLGSLVQGKVKQRLGDGQVTLDVTDIFGRQVTGYPVSRR